jgi:hypothetical protein
VSWLDVRTVRVPPFYKPLKFVRDFGSFATFGGALVQAFFDLSKPLLNAVIYGSESAWKQFWDGGPKQNLITHRDPECRYVFGALMPCDLPRANRTDGLSYFALGQSAFLSVISKVACHAGKTIIVVKEPGRSSDGVS